MGIKSTVAKGWNQLFEMGEQVLDRNVQLTADLNMRKNEKLIEQMFDQLVIMDADLVDQVKRINDLGEVVNKTDLILQASITAGVEADVRNALVKKKLAQKNLDQANENISRDGNVYNDLKAKIGDAKNKLEQKKSEIKFLKARKKSMKIQRELIGTGKEIVFPDSDDNMGLDKLKSKVEEEEQLIKSETKLAKEIGGIDIEEKITEDELDAEVKALMKKK